MSESRFKVPHTLVLLFGMVVVAFLLTHLLPQGEYQRTTNEAGREQVVPGSYTRLEEPTSLSPATIFTAIPRGFEAAQDIIFFIFIVGGAFGVLRATGAVDAGLAAMLRKLGRYPAMLIAGAMIAFAAGSATIGMAEEYLPFVPILVALCLALRFDAMTAVGTLCIGYGIGYGAAVINPFTVVIAQQVAEVPPTSGWAFRLVLLPILLLVGFHHVWRYASRVKADPSLSLVPADAQGETEMSVDESAAFTARHGLVLALVVGTIALLVWGIKFKHWYLVEMGGIFLALSVLLGLISGLGMNRIAQKFCSGAAELTTTALLVGFARSIQTVLVDGQIVDTIVHGIAQPLSQMGASAAAIGMLVVQSLLNFFIPSGSGQAYVTMPLMAPIGDLVGVNRQIAVLAYQFGDGFTNILVPTNAVLIGILTMAGIPYDRWLRFVLPFMIKIWIIAAIVMVVAVSIGYS